MGGEDSEQDKMVGDCGKERIFVEMVLWIYRTPLTRQKMQGPQAAPYRP